MIITACFQYKTKLIVSSINYLYLQSNCLVLELFDSAHFRLTGILLLSSILLFKSKYFR